MRVASGSRAASSHTGALVGSDAVFDAALRRSGTVRVKTYTQLFAATRPDFAPIYGEIGVLPDIPAEAILPNDREYAGAKPRKKEGPRVSTARV